MHHFDFGGRRILVVGDLMLDTYLDGSVGRISPEAPVPVVLRRSERIVLGGAANVVANLAALGASVDVVGVVGTDDNGALLAETLAALPTVRAERLVRDPGRPTTCKMRVMSGLHQMVRIDSEITAFLAPPVEEAIIAAVQDAVGWADVVVLSDYAKGVCTDRVVRAVVEAAGAAGKPSIVDPKRQDFAIYRGATLIKPNRRELSEATRRPCESDAEAEAAAAAAIATTGSAILLTRSEQGMSYVAPSGETLHLPTAARAVFDVSGAGDTVLALAALARAAELSIPETMRLANAAAGIVVSKVGTTTVTVAELDEALHAETQNGSPPGGALATLADAVRLRQAWGRRGLRVGFTNGCYDLLHPGHVSLLQQAAAACDRLVVAINSDRSVRRLKGSSRPVQDEWARAAVLGALRAVDLIVVFDEDTPAAIIAALEPDLLVKGADYTIETVVGADAVQAAGGRVLLVPLVAGQSTTGLIGRAADGPRPSTPPVGAVAIRR